MKGGVYMGRLFITGDTHGRFERLEYYQREFNITIEDLIIIVGDVGLNYHVNPSDGSHFFVKPYYESYTDSKRNRRFKQLVNDLGMRLFCIQGNHEARATHVNGYEEIDFYGGKALVQPEYPNLIFAIDGEVYNFGGKDFLVAGGAYSVDKDYRRYRYKAGDKEFKWFPEEQPDSAIKIKVENTLESLGYKVDYILTHTTPLKYIPTEMFLAGIDQSKVDKSTEEWLDKIEDKTEYINWFAGHYHTNKKIDRFCILFDDIVNISTGI